MACRANGELFPDQPYDATSLNVMLGYLHSVLLNSLDRPFFRVAPCLLAEDEEGGQTHETNLLSLGTWTVG